ncbi:hypothetical protein FHS40_007779 [Streptomyces spectabilis]|uniref:Uncharacterized protein n=1 Tax=Streptomyces spectabilis TaxID=68270 RepID=A0A7W8EX46_STRST|nr:hypothetical protein [Streptomyces spectabilis]
MRGRGARQNVINQGIKLSQRCVHHASGPRKVPLTDVGWAVGEQVACDSRTVASREVQFSDQPGQ